VADRLAADRDLRPSVWLEGGGRLRCVAGTGGWSARDGISATAGVIGATFTSGVESLVPDAAAHRATNRPRLVAQACLPIRADGIVVGVLDVELSRLLRAGDVERLRDAADELGRAVAAGGGPPAESPAQRMLRHMTTLSSLDEPDAIARALLPAALDVMQLDSAVLVRRERHAAVEPGAPPGGAASDGFEHRTGRGALQPVAAVGPLGSALAGLPPEAFDAIERAADDGAAGVVVATAADMARPELASVGAAGARALVAVGLVAHAEEHGLLLLAGAAERAVSVDDVELLELLAAHAATCLRTADLMRSLRAQAAADPLTGLGHHATFHATLAHAHRRPSTAVVVLDVDGFKRLNDTFGHPHGDHVLRGLAGALSGALRRGDSLFRIGGDEFAALLVVADPAEALEAGRRLRAAVVDAELGVTVSIGVAIPNEGETDAAVLGRADRALYRAKAEGRDGVALADDEPAGVTPPV